MRYPKFLSKNSTIGVVALSAGVGGYLNDYEKSIDTLKKNEFLIKETASVRINSKTSNTGVVRALEFDELLRKDNVDLIMCATGGDFAIEILPFVKWDNINNNIKWIMGASDPTSLLYVITTKLDIATLYGFNACSYDQTKIHESLSNSLEIIKGNLIEQHSYSFYEKDKSNRSDGYNLTEPVCWECLNGSVSIRGRIIGGCLDVLRELIGTKSDYTKNFIEKYKNDGIIWYFDVFALSCEDFYRTLFQMREAGWFSYVKGVVVGRVLIPSYYYEDFSYQEALKKIFGDIPLIFNADIGHVAPKMTIINGAIAEVEASGGTGKIKFELQ